MRRIEKEQEAQFLLESSARLDAALATPGCWPCGQALEAIWQGLQALRLLGFAGNQHAGLYAFLDTA